MNIKSLDHLQLVSKYIAEKVGKNDFIFLIGEIGVGKTTFTRFFINYLQKREGVQQTQVLSPTFNLLYEYDINKIKIMHYDLYRIKKKEELNHLGIFNENEKKIKIIEWPQLIENNVGDRLELYFSYSKDENERDLTVKGKGKWKKFKLDEL